MENIALSPQAIMVVAGFSALFRAILNLIDRHQIGRQRLSIVDLSLYNNLIPAVLLASALWVLGLEYQLLVQIPNWRCVMFGALIQAVAYGFSYGFRHLTVVQASVAGKAADLVIPLGVAATAATSTWENFPFSVVTTLLFLPLLSGDGPGRSSSLALPAFVIFILVVTQGLVAPWLGTMAGFGNDPDPWKDALVFATSVIIWRTVWSLLPLTRKARGNFHSPWPLLKQPLFMLRVVMTVATQLTFIAAVTSIHSAAAWPILNSAGLLAMVLATVVMKEKSHRYQTVILLAVAGVSAIRFVTL